MVNASHPETDTSVMTMSFDDDRTITPPATPRVFTQQPSPHSTHPSPQVYTSPEIPETGIDGGDDVSYCDCSLKQEIPIQHTGWIQTVDHEEEVRNFPRKPQREYRSPNGLYPESSVLHWVGLPF
jgi:hypothetical protein